MTDAATVQIPEAEYAALVADARRYAALRAACLRRASHNHNQWLEILLQIPLGDPSYQVLPDDIDFAVDEAFGLSRPIPDRAASTAVGPRS